MQVGEMHKFWYYLSVLAQFGSGDYLAHLPVQNLTASLDLQFLKVLWYSQVMFAILTLTI